MSNNAPRKHPTTSAADNAAELLNSQLLPTTLPANPSLLTHQQHKDPKNLYISTYCPDGTIKSSCFVIYHPNSSRYYTWQFNSAELALEKLEELREEFKKIIAFCVSEQSVDFSDWLQDFLCSEFVPRLQDTQAQ